MFLEHRLRIKVWNRSLLPYNMPEAFPFRFQEMKIKFDELDFHVCNSDLQMPARIERLQI